jgi:hypothetical protein
MTAFSLWFGITPPKPEHENRVFLLLVALFGLIFAATIAFGFTVLYSLNRR